MPIWQVKLGVVRLPDMPWKETVHRVHMGREGIEGRVERDLLINLEGEGKSARQLEPSASAVRT